VKVEWLGDGSLSAKARDLVEFDMASIRQVIAGARGREPELWVVSTGDYESGGRVLRDSPHTRLVAYTAADHMLYGTDGCNSCARTFDLASRDWDSQTLDAYAAESGVPRPLLERLTALARD
jgi:hypothetical protein